MNDPRQIRRAMEEIRRALDAQPREALAEVLTLVLKEYVLEGQQPPASGSAVLDARSDLEGLSFAELIVWLQTHLDLPELGLFDVTASEVSVRVEGRSIKLRAQPAQPAPQAAPALAAPSPSPRLPASTAIPAQATATTPPASSGEASDKAESTAESGTRFSLLEVD